MIRCRRHDSTAMLLTKVVPLILHNLDASNRRKKHVREHVSPATERLPSSSCSVRFITSACSKAMKILGSPTAMRSPRPKRTPAKTAHFHPSPHQVSALPLAPSSFQRLSTCKTMAWSTHSTEVGTGTFDPDLIATSQRRFESCLPPK